MNVSVWVQRHGHRQPDAPALAAGERVHADWRTFAARTAATAAGMRENLCLLPGDRVAVVMRNRPEYLEALYAIWHAGLVAVPVNARLHRDEVAYVLDHSGSSVLITDQEHADDVEPLVGTIDGLRAAVLAPGVQWDRLTGSAPARLVDRTPNDPAWLFYTSGTTGRPKGATLTHRNRAQSCKIVEHLLPRPVERPALPTGIVVDELDQAAHDDPDGRRVAPGPTRGLQHELDGRGDGG